MLQRFLRHIETEKRYSVHTVNAYKRDLEQFSDFVKILNNLQLYLQQVNEKTSKELTETLQAYGDRNTLKINQLIQMLDEKIQQFKDSTLEENRKSRQEQLDFQNKFQSGVNEQLTKNRDTVDLRSFSFHPIFPY